MAIDKLSALDFAFLALESPESPKHVAGLGVYEWDKKVDPPAMRDLLAAIKDIGPAAPFDRQLDLSMLSLPSWKKVDDVDLDWHVRHVALPEPGSKKQLMQLVSRLHAKPLDRSRPLWEFYLIEGLKNGRFATYFKVHHAYMDGASMSRRITSTFSESPDDTALTPIWGSRFEKPELTRQDRKLFETLVGGLRVVGSGVSSLSSLGGLALQHGLQAAGLRRGPLPLPFSAPRSRLNEPVTRDRGVAAAQLSLKKLRKTSATAGVTINDVLLSLCDAALSDYLHSIGEIPDKPLVAQMPISLRRAGEGKSGNQITIALVELATGEADPIARIRRISRQTAQVKGEYTSMSEFAATAYTLLLQSLAQASELVGADRILPPLGNVVVSNVIGPKQTLYFGGAKVTGMYPISTIPPGVSTNITFYTAGDTVNIGIVAGTSAVTDVSFLARRIVRSLKALDEALATRRI